MSLLPLPFCLSSLFLYVSPPSSFLSLLPLPLCLSSLFLYVSPPSFFLSLLPLSIYPSLFLSIYLPSFSISPASLPLNSLSPFKQLHILSWYFFKAPDVWHNIHLSNPSSIYSGPLKLSHLLSHLSMLHNFFLQNISSCYAVSICIFYLKMSTFFLIRNAKNDLHPFFQNINSSNGCATVRTFKLYLTNLNESTLICIPCIERLRVP